MTEPKEKRKPVVQRREPKKRTDSGYFDNLRLPQTHPVEEFLPPSKTVEQIPNTMSTQSTNSTLSTHSSQTPISPTRDFMKVANSIHREAVPSGLFKGKCKQIYDFLYSKTRGAIVPSRSIRLTRREIMVGADIGSTKTLFLNLRHLRGVGLVSWDERVGPHDGNVYTVNLPEELTMGTQSTQSTLSTESASSPKVLRVLVVESTQSTHSLSPEDTTTSEDPKTLFKTKEIKTDDEAFAGMVVVLKKLVTEVTGKDTTVNEAERWKELAEVLSAELKIAAARTTVSSVPAFLSEHLRRRLWKIDKRQAQAEGRELPDEAVRTPTVSSDEGISNCPDCRGSGWWYPEGTERGVAKCKHTSLNQSVDAEN